MGQVAGVISEQLRLRRYRATDHETVMRLHEAELRKMGTFIEGHELDKDLLDIEGIYLEDEGDFLIGELDGRIVAMGALRKTSANRAEIKRMRVNPEFQRRGFGQAILTALHRRAAELGYETLHLDTGVGHEAARCLYEKNGYREVRRGMIGPVECVFYEKGNLA